MWFYIVLTILVLLTWWLTRTNLYRHRRRHGPDSTARTFGSTGDNALNNAARFRGDGKRLR